MSPANLTAVFAGVSNPIHIPYLDLVAFLYRPSFIGGVDQAEKGPKSAVG